MGSVVAFLPLSSFEGGVAGAKQQVTPGGDGSVGFDQGAHDLPKVKPQEGRGRQSRPRSVGLSAVQALDPT